MIAIPICAILSSVKIEAYLRGLEMATKRSKAMANSTEDSNDNVKLNEKHLWQAGIKADLPGIKPEYTQHGDQGRYEQAEVSGGQHGEEIIHGFVEAGLSDNGKENQAISWEGGYVEKAERNGDPGVEDFQPRNTS